MHRLSLNFSSASVWLCEFGKLLKSLCIPVFRHEHPACTSQPGAFPDCFKDWWGRSKEAHKWPYSWQASQNTIRGTLLFTRVQEVPQIPQRIQCMPLMSQALAFLPHFTWRESVLFSWSSLFSRRYLSGRTSSLVRTAANFLRLQLHMRETVRPVAAQGPHSYSSPLSTESADSSLRWDLWSP